MSATLNKIRNREKLIFAENQKAKHGVAPSEDELYSFNVGFERGWKIRRDYKPMVD